MEDLFARRGLFERFKLDRGISKVRPSRWSKSHISTGPGCRRIYVKLDNVPVLEREMNLADQYMSKRHGLNEPQRSKEVGVTVKQVEVPTVSLEDAERVTQEMINSYSRNNPMRELLEDARYFAGAGTMSGAITVRRARAQVQKFEIY